MCSFHPSISCPCAACPDYSCECRPLCRCILCRLLNLFIGKWNITVSSNERDQRASRIAVRKREFVTVTGGAVIGAATKNVSLDLS